MLNYPGVSSGVSGAFCANIQTLDGSPTYALARDGHSASSLRWSCGLEALAPSECPPLHYETAGKRVAQPVPTEVGDLRILLRSPCTDESKELGIVQYATRIFRATLSHQWKAYAKHKTAVGFGGRHNSQTALRIVGSEGSPTSDYPFLYISIKLTVAIQGSNPN